MWPDIQSNSSDLRILITGASGFVGGRLVEACHLCGCAQPIALVRNWTRAARPARFPVEIRTCDIQDRDQMVRAAEGANAIVHCAYTDDRASIVEGTRHVLEAAASQRVRHLVFLSTAEVYGSHVQGTVTESTPTTLSGNLYADAKIEAESLCRDFQGSFGVTIFRPSIIYGPFGASWSIQIAKRLQSGRWRLLEHQGEGTANLVYVDDLVRAILLALHRNAKGTDVFNLNGPDRITWNQYFQQFNTALGLPPMQRISVYQSRLRTLVMDQVAHVTGALKQRYYDQLMAIYLRNGWISRQMKRLKGSIDNTPSGNELNQLYCRPAYYSDQRARDALRYEPQFDLSRGLRMTVAWLRHHEYVEDGGRGVPDGASGAFAKPCDATSAHPVTR